MPIATAKTDPNHEVAWRPTRPEFSIHYLRGTSTSRGYHESFFEVVSLQELDADDFRRLDECGLLGMGQAYSVGPCETFTEDAPPVTVDRRTGSLVPDAPPVNWNGETITTSHAYKWHRYVVKRICDSGD